MSKSFDFSTRLALKVVLFIYREESDFPSKKKKKGILKIVYFLSINKKKNKHKIQILPWNLKWMIEIKKGQPSAFQEGSHFKNWLMLNLVGSLSLPIPTANIPPLSLKRIPP